MPKKEISKRVAYVEDADDSGNAIPDTETYADSMPPSPSKQQPNTGKARREMRRIDSTSSGGAGAGYTDSDSTVHSSSASRRESKSKSKEKDKVKSPTKRVTISSRPDPPRHFKTTPAAAPRRSDEASYYGVSNTAPMMTPGIARPRAQSTAPRPSSYYGPTSKPPLANARYYDMIYASQPLATAPSPLPPTSYPPHPTLLPREHPFAPRGPVVSQTPVDYFSTQPHAHLVSRFNRPASAMGHRTTAPSAGYGEYEVVTAQPLARRASLRAAREQDDRLRMPPPPPPRPISARPRASSIRPPPRSAYDDEAFRGESTLYQDVSPLGSSSYDQVALAPGMRARRGSFGFSTPQYDTSHTSLYRTEVAGSGGSRRNSYYGQSYGSNGAYEDKVRQASAYQEDVSGGPSPRLTAETLRKASKSGASGSRSTRSSASREESEYKHSATTRTTRSSANDEDLTIRVKGGAVLKVGGAEMQCVDGAEINISRNGTSRGGGSDRASFIEVDDRRSRVERPPTRTRVSSQSGSYTRTTPTASYDPYGYPPPYPAYPGTYATSRPDDFF